MTEPDWWRSFFLEPWSRIQAGGYAHERTCAECDLIQRALDFDPPARILDIPCGIGRHSVELARRGFHLTGVDFNPDFIATARAHAAAAEVRPNFLVSDMRAFTSSEKFDAAFCYFGSFGYFTGDGDRTFVHAVATTLRSGGRFLIEGHLLETLLPIYRERDWFWAGSTGGSTRVLEERSWDIETGRMEATWTTIDERGVQSSSTSVRIYAYRELRDLLHEAGFGSVKLLDGKTGQAFRLGATRALVVAENP
jgi:SAM-dependent methyltransferase